MRRIWGPAVLAFVLALTGCTSSGDSSTAERMDAASGGAVAGSPEKAADGLGSEVTADADRQVVVTGKVSLSVDDPIVAVAEVARLVESTGGRIQERYETAAHEGGSPASASVVARIPADQVTPTLDRLAAIGEVLDSALSSTEVTAQARDLDARIRALQISITRLEDLLTRSGTVADIVAAEQVLTDRQSQLEQLQSQRAALAEQVAMSTITIMIWPKDSVPEEPPTGFVAGLRSGWNALVTTVGNVLTVLGVLVPWLAVAGLLLAVAVPVTRRLRRRDAATAPRPASPEAAAVPATAPAPAAAPAAAPDQAPDQAPPPPPAS